MHRGPPGGRSGHDAPFATGTILGWAWVVAAACGGDDVRADRDRGPIEDALDPTDRAHWPGTDVAEGRVIPRYNGFGAGRPISRWILGTANPAIADSYWFCRDEDPDCPLDGNRRLGWDHLVGHPVFEHVPGRGDYTPFWQMWKVTVPADFEEDSAKRSATVRRLADDREVTLEPLVVDFGEVFGESVGPQDVLVHCPLALSGTILRGNGDVMADGKTPMTTIPTREGWWDGYRVGFFDFSVSEGVFPPDRLWPRMRTATLHSLRRDCLGADRTGVCRLGMDFEEIPVDETVIHDDITGDGDLDDTNNIVGGLPCEEPLFRDHPIHPDESVYSPLRSIWTVVIPALASPEIDLIDTYGDQRTSDIRSLVDLFARVDAGELGEPTPWPDDEVEIFLHAPMPVRFGHVPFPCSEND